MSIAYPTQPSSSATIANIQEQPAVAQRCLDMALTLPDHIQQINIAACGSSRHAGLVAKVWFEQLARIATRVDDASEYANQLPLPTPQTMLQLISQSGFTADVLAAAQAERSRALPPHLQPHLLGLTNGSATPLEDLVDTLIQTPAGEEQAVAATKTFLAQLIVLLRMALHWGEVHSPQAAVLQPALAQIPDQIQTILDQSIAQVQKVAQIVAAADHLILLGRGINAPIAQEGALKLKETCYLHAEGFAAGDFMHGPIALVEPGLPVIVIALPNSPTYAAVMANAQRIKSYGAYLIGITSDDPDSIFDAVLPIAAVPELLSPLLTVIPLQLLAYQVAELRGLAVDRPRHLTKFIA
jgi:glucosamine 6-phosphate synthetase-like amidotransferase/phosphosugar isomerase protein